MAKEKNSSDKSTSKKTAAKKTPAKKAAAPKKSGATEAAVSAAPVSPAHKGHPSASELYEEIRRRAYELYCARGGQHGSHEADWQRAETEVRAKYKA